MKLLVLGGTGLLGPFVVRQLSGMGHDVTIFHTGAHEPDLPPEVKHIHSPLARLPITEVPTDLKSLAPDVLIMMHPNGADDAPLVMREFRGVAGRVVAISSIDVYRAFSCVNGIEPGPPDPVPLTEDSPLRDKLYPYRTDTLRAAGDPRKDFDTYDKILVERAILSDPDLPGTALRLPMIYGPGDRQNRLYGYIKPMDDARPAILLDEGLSQWRAPRGYVENVAWAITLAATDPRAAGRIYNVAEQTSYPEAGWAARIAQATGWPGEIAIVPKGRIDMPIDTAQHLTVDSTRIRQELGYTEIVLPDEGLRRAIEWERANPPHPEKSPPPDYEEEDRILEELASGI
jgi:nucleoside-diphosphate-sugar epimerase